MLLNGATFCVTELSKKPLYLCYMFAVNKFFWPNVKYGIPLKKVMLRAPEKSLASKQDFFICRHNCCVTSKKLGSRDFKYISRSIQRICHIRFSVLLLKYTLFGMFLGTLGKARLERENYMKIPFKRSKLKKKINWMNFF